MRRPTAPPGHGKPLTLTAYAVLGLVATTPHSGYEIAAALTRGVAGNLFARRPSASYDEPRRLAAQGLLVAERVFQGRRPRSVYSLTDAGRQALADWLGQPSARPVIEVEALLKVLFADAAGPGDPRRAVEELGRWAEERLALGEEVVAGYQAGTGRLQRSRFVRLTIMANIELVDAVARWSRRAAHELDAGAPEGFDDLAEDLRRRAAAHRAR